MPTLLVLDMGPEHFGAFQAYVDQCTHVRMRLDPRVEEDVKGAWFKLGDVLTHMRASDYAKSGYVKAKGTKLQSIRMLQSAGVWGPE